MWNKILFFFLFGFFCFSCSHNSDDSSFTILSPKEDWTYYDNQPIIFASDLKFPEQRWISSIDGELGYGNQFEKELTAGFHTVSLEDTSNGRTKEIHIKVQKHINLNNYSIEYITKLPRNKKLKNGKISFFALDGIVENLIIKTNESKNNLDEDNGERLFLCDNIIKPFSNTKDLKTISTCKYRSLSQETSIRNFYVLNTSNTYSEPTQYKARLYYSDEKIEIWFPEELFSIEYEKTRSLIDKCIVSVKKIIIPRLCILWGNCADINKDSKIAVLFAPSINYEQKALGFFYASDFFERNTNKTSPSYNPYSNEIDMIYVAIPEETGNYSVNSIIATIAHELTHAINFSNNNFTQLETFLDEGLSHLTESLCGYGISGGNMKFVDYYLSNSAYFSFCESDYLGNSDSAGQRGAILLFLYWLFEKYGGIIQNPQNQVEFIDNGGISFLHKIISSDSNGWSAIGDAVEKNTDILFKEFAQEILTKRIDHIFDFSKKDCISDEPIFCCKELLPYDFDKNFKLLPYSLFLITDTVLDSITISATSFDPFFVLTQ